MSTSQNGSDETPIPPDRSTVVLLIGTIADTTWRMFIPIIGLLMVGVWVDKTYNTIPIAIVVLTSLGIVIATLLIRSQLRNLNKK